MCGDTAIRRSIRPPLLMRKSYDHSDLHGRSVVFQNFTNSSSYCHTTDFTPSFIGTSVPTRQGPENIQNNGPPYDVQTHLPEKQRVGDGHVGGSDRLQEGIRFRTTCSNLEISRNHSVSEQYICLLINCTLINATVLTDVESDELGIARGTKKGDPLSSLLFNSVL